MDTEQIRETEGEWETYADPEAQIGMQRQILHQNSGQHIHRQRSSTTDHMETRTSCVSGRKPPVPSHKRLTCVPTPPAPSALQYWVPRRLASPIHTKKPKPSQDSLACAGLLSLLICHAYSALQPRGVLIEALRRNKILVIWRMQTCALVRQSSRRGAAEVPSDLWEQFSREYDGP